MIRENEIFGTIKNNPYISQDEIANKLSIKRSSVADISNLIKKGDLIGKAYVFNENIGNEACVLGAVVILILLS